MVKELRESFRDKTRNILCTHLVSLGINTKLVEKGAPEDIGSTRLVASLGGIGVPPSQR